jgi:dephospho-CoA kinase
VALSSLPKLAITGGIAEGKTTVLGYVKAAGVSAASVDDIARDVFLETAVQNAVSELLGISPPVDVETLRDRIAADHSLRRSLNEITHPLILERILSAKERVLEVPLLIETCLHGLFSRVWVVTCGREEQLRRLSTRLKSREAALRWISTQLPTEVKCPFADRVVRTNVPEPSVHGYVIESLERDLA